MSYQDYQAKFQDLAVKRQYRAALSLIDEMLTNNLDPNNIIKEIISKTLQRLQKFDEDQESSGFSSLTLLAISKICDDAIKKIFQLLPRVMNKIGTVVIGTPTDDYHALGKTIVSAILRASGWEVIDLGLNVKAETFIEEAEKSNAQFILISAFLLPSAFKVKKTADLLNNLPKETRPKLIVGGPPFNFHFGLNEKLGADGMGIDAFDAVRILNSYINKEMDNQNSAKPNWMGKFKKRVFGFRKRDDKK